MLRCVLILLLAASTAAADKAADRIINRIMERFDVVMKDPVARKAEKESADSLCIRYVDHIKMCGKSTTKKACAKLSKGFDPKYKADREFHACLAKLLAASGKPGADALYSVYRKSSKRDEVRGIVVVALGNCRECCALDALRKMMLYEKSPEVLAQIVRACGKYNRGRSARSARARWSNSCGATRSSPKMPRASRWNLRKRGSTFSSSRPWTSRSVH